MGFFSSMGQFVLVILNIIFVLVSLILFVVGIILKFFPGVLLQFLFDGVTGITHFKIPNAFNDINNVPLFDDLGMASIIFGVVLFVVAFLACCGACYKWRPLLGGFCVCVIILILAISTVGGLFLSPSSPMHSKFKDQLSKEVYSQYKGPKNDNVFSLVINILCYSLNCCGMKGPNDFNSSASWTTYKVDNDHTIHIDVTPACCVHSVLAKNDLSCAQKQGGKFNTAKTNTEGCYDKILDLVRNNQKYPIIIIVVLIILLALELLFAIVIIRNESESPV